MRIAIVGDGKVGSALTEQLAKEGHDIVVIDSNKAVLREAVEELDVMVVHGNGATLKVQDLADVEHSDLLIAATSADEINLLCCIIARKLGCPHTIARVRNPEYAHQLYFLKDELGLSMMVNPELAAASEIFRLLQFPSFLQRDSFAKGRVEIVEIEVRGESKLIGKKLAELYKTARVKVLVCAVERGDDVLIPDGNFKLRKHDKLYVTASSKDLAKLIHNLGLERRKIRNVLIVGGGNIAYYLAEDLIASGVDVKIIEIDPERCLLLAEALPRATVIEADGSERGVLDSEGIGGTDAVVTLTNIDEENLIISMYADFAGVSKVITKINRTEYHEVFRDRGIECVVSPKELCSHEIVRYVRAMHNTTEDSIITLHRIVGGRMEALEFKANENTWYLGMTLSQLRLKKDILIACISRQGEIIIPQGSDSIRPGDTVIVVTTAEKIVHDLNDIFEEQEERFRFREARE